MKVTCDREQLLAAFQTAAIVVPARSPRAILRNIKLEIGNEGTILMATDMEVGIRMEVGGVEVESGGSFLAPVIQLGSILRESTDEKLQIETDGNATIIRGARSEFRLPWQSPEEFPSVASFGEESYHELSSRLFRELIRRTLFATDVESSRYALGGVLLELDDEHVTAVATDGRRLAKMEGPARGVGATKKRDTMTIVPSRAMQLMERAMTESDADVQIAARANDVLVRSPRTTIYSRLVEGRFPKWQDVFPVRQTPVRIELAVGPLYTALRQASIVASEESRGIVFQFVDGSLVLSARTADLGQSRVEFPVSYVGTPLTITLDHRFVADFLRVLEPDKSITVELQDSESAAVLMTDDGYAYVVMPLSRDT